MFRATPFIAYKSNVSKVVINVASIMSATIKAADKIFGNCLIDFVLVCVINEFYRLVVIDR